MHRRWFRLVAGAIGAGTVLGCVAADPDGLEPAFPRLEFRRPVDLQHDGAAS